MCDLLLLKGIYVYWYDGHVFDVGAYKRSALNNDYFAKCSTLRHIKLHVIFEHIYVKLHNNDI